MIVFKSDIILSSYSCLRFDNSLDFLSGIYRYMMLERFPETLNVYN